MFLTSSNIATYVESFVYKIFGLHTTLSILNVNLHNKYI